MNCVESGLAMLIRYINFALLINFTALTVFNICETRKFLRMQKRLANEVRKVYESQTAAKAGSEVQDRDGRQG